MKVAQKRQCFRSLAQFCESGAIVAGLLVNSGEKMNASERIVKTSNVLGGDSRDECRAFIAVIAPPVAVPV